MDIASFFVGIFAGGLWVAALWLAHVVKEKKKKATPPGQSDRPPVGVIPMYLWEEQRYCDLTQAILRYTVAHKPIPQEWKNELEHLGAKINNRLNSPNTVQINLFDHEQTK